eukprot:Skav210078  [mRNA]  locus=scaffold916:12743:13003:- [translate_table: standard]
MTSRGLRVHGGCSHSLASAGFFYDAEAAIQAVHGLIYCMLQIHTQLRVHMNLWIGTGRTFCQQISDLLIVHFDNLYPTLHMVALIC